MIQLIAIIISIVLLIAASSVAISFMKLTKYSASWLLLSLAFVFLAVLKVMELFVYFQHSPTEFWLSVEKWLGVLISVCVICGVILIREIFLSYRKSELYRTRAEHKMLNVIINTEESERLRMAKELHDGLGPLLSAVKMSLSVLPDKITDPHDKEILANANLLVNESINTLKDISNNLSPHVLTNFGLESALNSFVSKINQSGVVEIVFKSNMGQSRLNGNKEIVLYRAVCELINNAFKHSGAKRVDISLDYQDKYVILQYSDNGRGFDMNKVSSEKNGMGISNIKTRVNSIDGVFVLESHEGRGTTALIKIVN